MKKTSIFKSSIKLITIFIPQSTLVRIAGGIALWAAEALVRNTKSDFDDKGLEMVKKLITKEKAKKKA